MNANEVDEAILGLNEVGARFDSKKLHLKYHSAVDKELLHAFIHDLYAVKRISICHEMYHEPGTGELWHTHCLVEFVERHNIVNMNRFDYEGIHPNWKSVVTKGHWQNCVKYHKKEDPSPYCVNIDLLLEAAQVIDDEEDMVLRLRRLFAGPSFDRIRNDEALVYLR